MQSTKGLAIQRLNMTVALILGVDLAALPVWPQGQQVDTWSINWKAQKNGFW